MSPAVGQVKTDILALGRSPLQRMHTGDEPDRQEGLLARRCEKQKGSMPAGVVRELERMRVELSEALAQHVLAFMRTHRRRPKRSKLTAMRMPWLDGPRVQQAA